VFGKTHELKNDDNEIITLSTKTAVKHHGCCPEDKFGLKGRGHVLMTKFGKDVRTGYSGF
jgi:hypothetical protein